MNKVQQAYHDHIANCLHEANSYIGLAKMRLKENDPEGAYNLLERYCEVTDRLEVRYLGWQRAEKFLHSGIILKTEAFADEVKIQKEKSVDAG